MIKFKAAEGKLFGIGLSRENCKRLLDGKPIFFKASEIGYLDGVEDVLIVGGEDEAQIKDDLETQLHLSVGPDTEVHGEIP